MTHWSSLIRCIAPTVGTRGGVASRRRRSGTRSEALSASRWFGAGEPGLVPHKNLKPVGARSAYSRVGFFLPGHSIPATFLDNGSSLPGACLLQCFESCLLVRLAHELSDTDRRPRRQDRRIAPILSCTGGCPPAPGKADDRCNDRSTKKCPSSKLKLRHGFWLH